MMFFLIPLIGGAMAAVGSTAAATVATAATIGTVEIATAAAVGTTTAKIIIKATEKK